MDAATTFRWLDQIADDRDLPPISMRVAVILRRFFNSRTGAAWPSQPTLIAATGLSRSGLRKALRGLEDRGHLAVTAHHGRGGTNSYRALLRNDHGRDPLSEEKDYSRDPFMHENDHGRDPIPEVKGHARDPERVTPVRKKGHTCAQERVTPVTPEPIEYNPSRNPLNEPVILPDDNNDRSSRKSSDQEDDAFAQFWDVYPRRVSKGAARKAFTAALKKTGAQTLIAGARRYASASIQTEPRYIKHAASWLNAEAWLDEPEPTGNVTLDANGNELARSSGPTYGGKRYANASEYFDKIEADIASGKVRCPW